MKRIILVLFTVLLLLACLSCSKKADTEADKMPADVKEAEMMDSTRFDSLADTLEVEEVEAPADSQ